MSSGMFAIKGTVGSELRRFKSLAATEPDKSKKIYADGEKLVILASKGEHAQFKRFASGLDREDIIAYFTAKSLMASLIGGHLMLSTFILDNGYPVNVDSGLPNILHDCLRDLSDYECVAIAKLFIAKGLDVNKQEPKTWYSPLHIAVSRGLADTVDELIASAADVNIVGAEDVMPLVLAQNLDESVGEKQRIIDALTQKGARLTWRRQNAQGSGSSGSSLFDTAFTSNTEIRAGPSTNILTMQLGATAAPVSTLPVPQAAAAGGTRVRFNGASMQLESVVLPVPPKVPVNPHSMPLPKVTVSTSSGERLQPPPRVATADSGAGPVAVEELVGGMNELSVDENTEPEEAEEEFKESGVAHSEQRSALHIAPEMLVGSVQLSEDGAAMLFSTG